MRDGCKLLENNSLIYLTIYNLQLINVPNDFHVHVFFRFIIKITVYLN